jgi:inhibitor of KinA sporulation pathway (predicted exonuclease)
MSHKEAVIYDLEYTTWPGACERKWSGKGENREIIRIGAIRIDLDSLQEIEALDLIVKPSVNPILSDYCVKVTDITDEQIKADGIGLHEVLHKFVGFVGKRDIFSYGHDILIILENLWLNNIAFNARTLKGDRSISINEYDKDNGNQTDSHLESNVVEVLLYGSNTRNTLEKISEGVHVETNLHGNCMQLTHAGLHSWFHASAPETQGKMSGEIAKTLGNSELKGKMHNPLFDVRSLHMGLRELILSRHIENPLK